MKMKRVLILGGGFGGIYAALEFEKRQDPDFEVTLISQDNFFLFTPMLHEVAASDLDLTHIVNPIRKMLRYVHFFEGEVRSVDVVKHEVVVSHGSDQHTHSLEYDDVVFALGSVTNFYNIPGLQERAVTMKSLGDAIALRNRLIEHLEEADTECAAGDREPLLTFVVAGGGFAGVETIGSINDFLKEALPYYPSLKPEMVRVVLVHPGDFVLPELGENLGRYASRKLAQRGVEIHPNTKIKAVTRSGVELSDGTQMAIFAQPLKKVKFAILPVVLVSLEFRTGDVLRFKPPEVNKIRRRVISSRPNVAPSLSWSSIQVPQKSSPKHPSRLSRPC